MGISCSTLKDWASKYSAISATLKKGKAPVDIEVENSLLKRALGYDTEETVEDRWRDADGNEKIHRRKMKRHIPADVTAIIFWLKNRKPEQWREKRNIIDAEAADDPLIEMLRRLDDESKETTPQS